MKEHPILFSALMVQAILDGRKTQTRRLVKPQPVYVQQSRGICSSAPDWSHIIKCPYGQRGDRLWVRETWQGPLLEGEYDDRPADVETPKYCVYHADDGYAPEYMDADDNLRQGWRPSIHMPRWASRILLEITSIRVERLLDISIEDAKNEGLKSLTKDGVTIKYGIPDKDGQPGMDDIGWPWALWNSNPIAAFKHLWMGINGLLSWEENPWVWVIEFRRIEA
ncbi:MAG: hypothetical protein ABIT70_12470 [Sulfuriferula sp.]